MPQRSLATFVAVAIALCAGLGCQTVPVAASIPDAPQEAQPPPTPPAYCPMSVSAEVLFELNSCVVKTTAENLDSLNKIERALTGDWPRHGHVMIVGRTCDLGDADYNKILGLKRAEAVKALLVLRGIAERRISANSEGESKPVVPNTSASNRSLNRRVELHTE